MSFSSLPEYIAILRLDGNRPPALLSFPLSLSSCAKDASVHMDGAKSVHHENNMTIPPDPQLLSTPTTTTTSSSLFSCSSSACESCVSWEDVRRQHILQRLLSSEWKQSFYFPYIPLSEHEVEHDVETFFVAVDTRRSCDLLSRREEGEEEEKKKEEDEGKNGRSMDRAEDQMEVSPTIRGVERRRIRGPSATLSSSSSSLLVGMEAKERERECIFLPQRICGVVGVAWIPIACRADTSPKDGLPTTRRILPFQPSTPPNSSSSTSSLANSASSLWVPSVEGYLQLVVVHPSYRGGGVGKALLHHCLATQNVSLSRSFHPSMDAACFSSSSSFFSCLRASESSLHTTTSGTVDATLPRMGKEEEKADDDRDGVCMAVVQQWRLHTLKPLPSSFVSSFSSNRARHPFLAYLYANTTPEALTLWGRRPSPFLPASDADVPTTTSSSSSSSSTLLPCSPPSFAFLYRVLQQEPEMDAIEREARDSFLVYLFQSVQSGIRATIRLYERFGFTTRRYLPYYYGQLLDGTEMTVASHRIPPLPPPGPLSPSFAVSKADERKSNAALPSASTWYQKSAPVNATYRRTANLKREREESVTKK